MSVADGVFAVQVREVPVVKHCPVVNEVITREVEKIIHVEKIIKEPVVQV